MPTTTARITPNEGELVEIARSREISVADGMLVAQLMPEDFTRGGDGAVRFSLLNSGAADIEIVSAAVQDSVVKAGNLKYDAKRRRFTIELNRFRWENDGAGGGTPIQRVQTAVTLEGVLKVRCRGISPTDKDRVFELLAILFEPTDGCGGTVTLTLAGGADLVAIRRERDEAIEEHPSAALPGPRHAAIQRTQRRPLRDLPRSTRHRTAASCPRERPLRRLELELR